MFRMCASNSHSYTHLIQALGIVREPTVWVFITSKYPGTRDIGLPHVVFSGQANLPLEAPHTIPRGMSAMTLCGMHCVNLLKPYTFRNLYIVECTVMLPVDIPAKRWSFGPRSAPSA